MIYPIKPNATPDCTRYQQGETISQLAAVFGVSSGSGRLSAVSGTDGATMTSSSLTQEQR